MVASTAHRRSLHGHWSSRFAFVLALSGSAVGLGNIWKFPYIAGVNGGGAFVLVYLVCVFAIGLPIMMSEILIGRRGRRNPVATMGLLGEEARFREVVFFVAVFLVVVFLVAVFLAAIGFPLS